MTRRHGLSTIAIHGRPRRGADWSPAVTPIYQSSTFRNPVGSDEEVLYTRYGNNPNQVELARKYALLEGAERAIFVASGMAATALAHLAVLRPGDHLVSSLWIYGGTKVLFDGEFVRLGIERHLCRSRTKPRDWRKACARTPAPSSSKQLTNPVMRVVNVPLLAKLAREHGIALLVDSTFASPINFRPLEHGADIVITSATKYLNGHSDVIAGAVAGSTGAHRGGHPADARLGTVDRPARGMADRARHEDAGAPGRALQRQRARRRQVGQRTARVPGGALPRPQGPPRPRARGTIARRVRRPGGPGAQGRRAGSAEAAPAGSR